MISRPSCTNMATHRVIYVDGDEEHLCKSCMKESKAYWGDAIYAILQLSSTFYIQCEGDIDDR